jgi:branched-chain amino acid transport system substrate-binding protein
VHSVVGTHGVYNMNPQNHNGLDERARVLVHVDHGAWHLMK